MKRLTAALLFLFLLATTALAANETVEDLLAQLEGKDPETISQERDEKKFAEELEKERIELKKKLKWETDSFNGTVGYRSKRSTSTRIEDRSIFFILHDTTSGPLLKCRYGFIHYNWIFVNEIRVNVDGETYFVRMYVDTIKPYFGWEYYDSSIFSQSAEELYLRIMNSERAAVRFFGSNGEVIDFVVSKNQKEALKEVMRYYYIREYQAKDITMEKYLEKAARIK